VLVFARDENQSLVVAERDRFGVLEIAEADPDGLRVERVQPALI
jgi:hypothetical protein